MLLLFLGGVVGGAHLHCGVDLHHFSGRNKSFLLRIELSDDLSPVEMLQLLHFAREGGLHRADGFRIGAGAGLAIEILLQL